MDSDKKFTRDARKEELLQATYAWLMGEKNISTAARSMGINASRQMVWFWEKGTYAPCEMTAWRVVLSNKASQEAKAWANKVLDIYSRWDFREYSLTDEVLNNLR